MLDMTSNFLGSPKLGGDEVTNNLEIYEGNTHGGEVLLITIQNSDSPKVKKKRTDGGDK